MEKEISIIIPTYNRRQSLRECLESLFAQKYLPDAYEIIVIDDGSTDGTDTLLSALKEQYHNRLIYLTQEHAGISKASNLGIRYAQGEIMVFADDDCMAPPNWIEKMVYFHRQYPHIAVIQGQVVNYYGNNLIAALEQRINEAYLDYIVYEENNHRYITLFSTGNCSLKKEVFKKKGMAFKERLLVYGDVDLSNQLTEKGVKILYAEEITVMHKYRTNLPDFIKRHVRDGRWRYVLRVIWHKTERDYNTKKFSPPKFFLKMSLGYVRDYKIRGIILIVLHAVRKLARVSGYLYQKMFSPNELYNKKIRTHR